MKKVLENSNDLKAGMSWESLRIRNMEGLDSRRSNQEEGGFLHTWETLAQPWRKSGLGVRWFGARGSTFSSWAMVSTPHASNASSWTAMKWEGRDVAVARIK